MPVYEFVMVRFLPKVKMGRDGVLEKMHDEVSDQDQQCCPASTQFQALWHHFYYRGCQHETGTQGDKVFQVAALPVALHDDSSAKAIGARRREPKQQPGSDGMQVWKTTRTFCFRPEDVL